MAGTSLTSGAGLQRVQDIGDGRAETGFGNLAVPPEDLTIDRAVPACLGDEVGLVVAEHIASTAGAPLPS